MPDSAADLWAAFLASGLPEAATAAGASYTSWHFGTGGAMADELAGLVLNGSKRATAGALWSYEHEGEALPCVGDYSVVLDGTGNARCVIRTVSVEVVAFSQVDEDFAVAEGEGDRSLDSWRKDHWHFFTVELQACGRAPEPDMPVVCERFEMVYPSEDASSSRAG